MSEADALARWLGARVLRDASVDGYAAVAARRAELFPLLGVACGSDTEEEQEKQEEREAFCAAVWDVALARLAPELCGAADRQTQAARVAGEWLERTLPAEAAGGAGEAVRALEGAAFADGTVLGALVHAVDARLCAQWRRMGRGAACAPANQLEVAQCLAVLRVPAVVAVDELVAGAAAPPSLALLLLELRHTAAAAAAAAANAASGASSSSSSSSSKAGVPHGRRDAEHVRRENAELARTLAARRAELQAAQAARDALAAETAALEARVRAHQTAVDASMRTAGELDARLRASSDARTRAEAAAAAQRDATEALRTRVAALQDAQRTAEAACAALEDEEDDDEDDDENEDNEDGSRRLAAVLAEREAEHVRAAEVQQRLAAAGAEQGALAAREQAVQAECEALERSIAETEAAAAAREAEGAAALAALQDELNAQHREHCRLQENVALLESETLDAQQQFQEQKGRQCALEVQLARARSEVIALTLAVDQARERARDAARDAAAAAPPPPKQKEQSTPSPLAQARSVLEQNLTALQERATQLAHSRPSRAALARAAGTAKQLRDAEEEARRQQLILARLTEQDARLAAELAAQQAAAAARVQRARRHRWAAAAVAVVVPAVLSCVASAVFLRR